MAYSYTAFTGNGSTTQYAVSFPYIRREHVAVTVAGIPSTFTWVNNSLIQMDAAPANGAAVRVYRTTPISAPLVDFADGATLVAADLDTNSRQSIYIQQELDDAQTDNLPNVIPNGNKGEITTSVGGTVWAINNGAVTEVKLAANAVTSGKIADGAVTEAEIATGAVTSAKIADGTIVDVDVSASAGIAATKLAFTQTGTSAVARTVDSRLEDRMSVKDFGAVGNGVADDTVAIRLALDELGKRNGGILDFPFGVYLVSSTIYIPRTIATPSGSVPLQASGLLIRGWGACLKGTGAMVNTTNTAGGTIFETAKEGLSTGATSNFGFNEQYAHYNTQIEGLRFENCGSAIRVFNFLQGCAIRSCIFSNVKTYIYAQRSFYGQFANNCGLDRWAPSAGSLSNPEDACYVFIGFVNVEAIQGNNCVGPAGAIKGIGFAFLGGTSGLLASNNSAERFDVGLYLGGPYYGALFHGWYFESNGKSIQIKDGNAKSALSIDGCWFNDPIAVTAETWVSGTLGPNNHFQQGTVNINNPESNATNAALNTPTVHLPSRSYEHTQINTWTRLPAGWDLGGGVRIIRNDGVYLASDGPITTIGLQHESSVASPSKAYTASRSGHSNFTAGVPFCVRTTNATSIDLDTYIGYVDGYESGIRFDFTLIGTFGTKRLTGTISGTTVFRDDADALTVTAANNSGNYRLTLGTFTAQHVIDGIQLAGGVRVI